MAQFIYRARSLDGQPIKGVVDAPNLEVATQELRDRQLIVVYLAERKDSAWRRGFSQVANRVSVRDVTFFARQFAVLINATIPIVRALRILSKQSTNDYFRKVIVELAAEVDGGSKLSQAISKFPRVFDPFFVHMIRAGETTGRLDQVFEYLADQKEKDYNLISRVRGAMIYPAFIISVMLGVGVLMMVYVLPPLADILTQTGAQIPFTTQLLLDISWVMIHLWWLLLLILALVGVGVWIYLRTESGQYAFDLLKIKLPIFGPIYQRIVMGRFSISLSNLLASGVPLPTSLHIVSDIVNNAVYHRLLVDAIKEVEAGNSLSKTFLHSNVVSPMIAQMITVGEETGKLDEILGKLGKFYAQEVEASLAILTSLIEPIIIILLGLGAFVMVSGVLAPIYSATSSVS